LDSIDRDAVGQVSQIQGHPKLVAVESGGIFALESVYLPGLVDWLNRPEDTPPLEPPHANCPYHAQSWTANANINGNLAMKKLKTDFYLVDITKPRVHLEPILDSNDSN